MKAGLASPAYGSAGGLVSYIVRTEGLEVNINNCSVSNCKIEGSGYAGGVIGWYNAAEKATVSITGLTLKNNKVIRNNEKTDVGNGGILASLYVGGGEVKDYVKFDGVTTNVSDNTVECFCEAAKDENLDVTGEKSVTIVTPSEG